MYIQILKNKQTTYSVNHVRIRQPDVYDLIKRKDLHYLYLEIGIEYKKYKSWTDEELLANARKYNNHSEWKKNNRTIYNVAHKRGLLSQCTAHMKKIKYWTDEELLADARKYNKPYQWKKNSRSAYATAINRDILSKCCSHMKIQ